MILLPVKNLESAKERLSPVLERVERRALAEAMLQDVMHALGNWRGRPDVAVVTSDPFATDLARQLSFEIIEDRVNRSETDAIQMATESCVARGAEWTLVIPGDIPLVQSSELEQILCPERRLVAGAGMGWPREQRYLAASGCALSLAFWE